MAWATDKIPLNIILIGKAGHGKSATGNSILGRTAFKRFPYLHSGTQFVTDASAEHGPYKIKVVDGPGFEVTDLDGVKNKEQMFENMAKASRMYKGGIQVYVLVIKFRFRYTEVDRQVISDLKKIFGENYLKHRGIIVMTGGYYFSGQMEADGTPGKTFEEWCREQDKVLRNLIEECSHRVVLFNNLPTSEEEQTRQRNELLFHVGQLQKEKGLYTTGLFQAHAQVRDTFIKDSKQKMSKETIQSRIDMLSAELRQLSIHSSLEDVDTLDACITGVFMEIEDEDLQEETLQQFTDSLEGLHTITEELRRAIREKNLSAKEVKALYTTKHFQAYEQVRDTLIKDSKQKMLEETIQKRLDMLSAELGQLSIHSSLEDVDTLDACITGVFMEIEDEDLQEETLQQFTDSLEGLHTITEKLRRAIRENNLSAKEEFRATSICRMARTTDKIPLNIILIGKTGHGKSATGNSILGQKAFKSSSNSTAETKFVTVAWAEHGPYEIKVVDGPGLEDTDLDAVMNKKQACENMAKALMLCNGGIHTFVLVIKFDTRYTQEERKAISDLKQIFGENYLKHHGIIVITKGDNFPGQMEADGTPGKTFNEWCRKQRKDFGDVIEECSPRVVLFNNISKSEKEQTRQRNELLFHAGQLQKEKGLYKTEHFQTYAQVRDTFIKDSKTNVFEETIQKRIHLLSAELGRLSIDSSLEDVDKLDSRITDVYTEIQQGSQQEESMQQLIGSLKRMRTTTEELRRAIREKNPRAVESNLVALSHHEKELKKTSEIPWGSIAACIGVGLAGAAATATGVAAIVVSGGTLAPEVCLVYKSLLDVAVVYLRNKLQHQ